MVRPLRVRPSDRDLEHFEEILDTANVSKQEFYSHIYRSDYHKDMRLFVTFPFTFANDPMKCEHLAEVVRVENLPDKGYGIAIRLIMTV
jgi:hypothetical protein